MISLPVDFLKNAKEFAGSEYDDFIKSLSENSPVGIRLNPFKKSDVFLNEEKIPWSENGRYLKQRPSFTNDPLFHAGCYYVQEPSSQFIEQPFLQAKKILNRPLKVLDLCAAPGGKSTHLISMMDIEDVLVSNEIVATRNNVLRQNIMKWGQPNVFVTQNSPADFTDLKNYFDIILVDAPCSGEGLFRKDENAREEWSQENVQRCTTRQIEILDDAYQALKDDGFIIYSTCTFEKSENDEQVGRIIDKYSMQNIEIENKVEKIISTEYGYLFFPHRIKGEGFYVSLLQKKSGDRYEYKNKRHVNGSKHIENYLSEPEDFEEFIYKDRLFAIPKNHFNTFQILQKKFYLRLAGIDMGEFKGNDYIPSEGLALSNYVSQNLSRVDVDLDTAIEFLRGNNILVNTENGFCIISYKNHNLGWVKKIGNRVNNYYLKEWRIKKSAVVSLKS